MYDKRATLYESSFVEDNEPEFTLSKTIIECTAMACIVVAASLITLIIGV